MHLYPDLPSAHVCAHLVHPALRRRCIPDHWRGPRVRARAWLWRHEFRAPLLAPLSTALVQLDASPTVSVHYHMYSTRWVGSEQLRRLLVFRKIPKLQIVAYQAMKVPFKNTIYEKASSV